MQLDAGPLLLAIISVSSLSIKEAAVVFDTFEADNSTCIEATRFGCLCESDEDCAKITGNLECIDFKCYCKYGLKRSYDFKLNKCVSLVGSTCSEEAEGSVFFPRCIRNAECEGGRCTCQEGFTETSRRSCLLAYGQECGPFQCNDESGLACKSGICACLDGSFSYSALTKRCFDPEAWVANVVYSLQDGTWFRKVFSHYMTRLLQSLINFMKFPGRFF